MHPLDGWIASQRDINTDLLFASVQTIGRIEHLQTLATTAFDYIVIDEFHHAAATDTVILLITSNLNSSLD